LADREVEVTDPVRQHQHSLNNGRKIKKAHSEIDSV
jgi:hypothetical protein